MRVKMPEPDREARQDAFARKTMGSIPDIMEDDLEPAHAPESDLWAMFRNNRFGPYMVPAEFPTFT